MNILRQGVSILKRAFPLGKRAWPKRKRAWPEKFSGGFAPGPPTNPVTKLPGSAPVHYIHFWTSGADTSMPLCKDQETQIFSVVAAVGLYSLLVFQTIR